MNNEDDQNYAISQNYTNNLKIIKYIINIETISESYMS